MLQCTCPYAAISIYSTLRGRIKAKRVLYIRAETNIRFSVRIVWMVKQANIPNSLNTPFYYENAYFILKYNRFKLPKIPLNLKLVSKFA